MTSPAQPASAAGRRDRSPPPREGPDDPIWQFLDRLERGVEHIEARIDRLYIAVGGGTILLAAIGLAAGFIARSS